VVCACLPINMVAREGDTAIVIRRSGKEPLDKLPCQVVGRIEPAFGCAQDLQGNGGRKLFLEQALMGGRIVGVHAGLMGLCKRCGRLRQGDLIIVQAPLDITVRCHEVLGAFALGTNHRLMVALQAPTHRFQVLGDVGPPTVQPQDLGRAIA
jgi:hypothetical protein